MGKTRRAKKAKRGGRPGNLYKSYGNRDLVDDNYRYAKTDPSTVMASMESNEDKAGMSGLLKMFSSQDSIQNVRNNPTLTPQQKTAMLQPLYQKNARNTSDYKKYSNRSDIDSARVDVGMKDMFRDIDRNQKAHSDNLRKAVRGYGGKSRRRSTRRRRQTKRR